MRPSGYLLIADFQQELPDIFPKASPSRLPGHNQLYPVTP